ncbi:hypothetical protein AB4865_05825 [Capnocytophaga sp. ARDL2]|uniref:hypothetical protein n=1 Tax=Capnocytophaga sp. ARDL2 TaxID=3238809 RepID=UPI003555D989
MKTTTILILTLICVSCSENQKGNEINHDNLFIEYAKKEKSDFDFLQQEILEIEKSKRTTEGYENFKQKTEDYITYLDEIIEKTTVENSNPFFQNDQEIAESKNFMNLTKEYLSCFEKFELSSTSKLRIEKLLGVHDVPIGENSFALYMYWYFNGYSPKMVVFQLEKRKRDVLLVKKDVLLND